MFIARAVEVGGPIIPNNPRIPQVPEIPAPYACHHPIRIKSFPHADRMFLQEPPEAVVINQDQPWRHELDHDTESVFWLLLYWAVGAQPEGKDHEPIPAGLWGNLMGSAEERSQLIWGGLSGATHSVYKPLGRLLGDLAALLHVDRYWLEPGDPRNNPGYLNEAFQRLILQFILSNRDEEFMMHPVAHLRRLPNMTSVNQSLFPIVWVKMYEDVSIPVGGV